MTTGVILLNFGEPSEPTREEVVPYLERIFYNNRFLEGDMPEEQARERSRELAEKRAALDALAPNPVAVSGLTGENVEELTARIEDELPDWSEERLLLPLSDDAMSLVSWLYDHGNVEREEYTGEEVLVEFTARPAIVEKARSKAAEVRTPPGSAEAGDVSEASVDSP